MIDKIALAIVIIGAITGASSVFSIMTWSHSFSAERFRWIKNRLHHRAIAGIWCISMFSARRDMRESHA